MCVVYINDCIARNQAEVSSSLSSTSFEVLLSLGGGDRHVVFHVKHGLCGCKLDDWEASRSRKSGLILPSMDLTTFT